MMVTRDERGLLMYDPVKVRSLFTDAENALDDEYMEKFRAIFNKRESGEISQEEYERLYEEIDSEWLEAAERLYDEEHPNQSKNVAEEKFFAPPTFAIA